MEKFIELVKRMRELQKEYFKTRRKDILVKSKEAEREVDKFIAEYGQGKLF